MFAEERREEIIKLLKTEGRIFVNSLAAMFKVSIDTIRRDLSIMEDKGLLKRTHGGAIPVQKVRVGPGSVTAREIDGNIHKNVAIIAKMAAALIEEGDTVFIGGSAIHYAMLKYLPLNIKYTVVTSSIIIAEELRSLDNIEAYMVCGKVRQSGDITDAMAMEFIKTLRIDKVFLVAGGLSVSHGLSNVSPEAAAFGKALASVSRKKICLSPCNKLGNEFFSRVLEAKDLDLVITDWEAPEDEIEEIKKLGLSIIVAEEEIAI